MKALLLRGATAYDRGEYPEAWDAYSEALPLARGAAGGRRDEANCLLRLAWTAYLQNRAGDGLRLAQRAHALSSDGPAPALTVECLVVIARTLQTSDRRAQASRQLDLADALIAKVADPRKASRLLLQFAYSRAALGQSERAERAGEQALARAKAANARDLLSRAENCLSEVLQEAGKLDAALAHSARAVQLAETVPVLHESAALALAQQADIYSEQDQSAEAVASARRAVASAERCGVPSVLMRVLTFAMIAAQRSSRYYEASEFATRLTALPWKAKMTTDLLLTKANAQEQCGNSFVLLGQWDRAVQCYAKAEPMFLGLGLRADYARCVASRGVALANKGDYGAAQAVLDNAKNLATFAGEEHSVAYARLGLGLLDWYQKRYKEGTEEFSRAGEYFAAAKKRDPDLNLRVGHSYALAGQALCRQYMGGDEGHRQALTLFDQAFRVYPRSDLRVMATWKGARAISEEAIGQDDAADRDFAGMISSLEQISQQVREPSEVSLIQDMLPHPYGRYAAFLGRRDPMAALTMVERGKGQGLARSTAANGAKLTRLIAPADAEELRAAERKLNSANGRLRAVERRPDPDESDALEALERERKAAAAAAAAAQDEYTAVRRRVLLRNPRYGQFTGDQQLTRESLERLVAEQHDTLFLEWAIADADRILLFAVGSRDPLAVVTLDCKERDLTRQVRAWREAMGVLADEDAPPERGVKGALPGAAEPELAGKLFDVLFGPVAARGLLTPGRYRRLVLVADGPLHELPFAALRSSSGRRLIEEFPLSMQVSLSTQTWTLPVSAPTADLLCVADPLGPAAPSVSGEVGGAPPSPRGADEKGRSRTEGGIRGEAHGVRRGRRFTPLTHARAEGEAVFKRVGGKSVLLRGPEAREGEVRRLMPDYALLHFATHGLLDTTDGMRSGLLMADEPLASENDGVLEAFEVADMALNARLAVLSACETARGQNAGGDGMIGMAWAFLAAGCPSVVASKWKVDDALTEVLVGSLVNHLQAGERKDDALRGAVLDVLKTGKGPYFWAAFEVIGDTRPLLRRP